MAQSYVVGSFEEGGAVKPPNLESSRSGVSWSAVFAGGVAAAGFSLVLMLIGAGVGLAALSPYAGDSMSATGLAVGAVIWLVVVQWVASALGGYMAGRLRTKWADHHSDEVFFRDSAHGLLAWAAATLLTVMLFTSGGLGALTAAGSNAALLASGTDATYFADQLFRAAPGATASDAPNATNETVASNASADTAAPATTPNAATPAPPTTTANAAMPAGNDMPRASVDKPLRDESSMLLQRTVAGTATDADKDYLAQVVASQTGMSLAGAKQRVDQVIASAKAAADTARKAAATASLMTAFSLLVGAFIAAVGGALGGKYRDELSTR